MKAKDRTGTGGGHSRTSDPEPLLKEGYVYQSDPHTVVTKVTPSP